MKTIKASEFKAICLQIMDDVAEPGDAVVITKNGKPVSKLVPYRQQPKSLFGVMKGTLEIKGDIMAPIDVEWDAER